MHTVNNQTQLICCVSFLYGAGELAITQPYLGHATSVNIYPLGTLVVRTSATEQKLLKFSFSKVNRKCIISKHFQCQIRDREIPNGFKPSISQQAMTILIQLWSSSNNFAITLLTSYFYCCHSVSFCTIVHKSEFNITLFTQYYYRRKSKDLFDMTPSSDLRPPQEIVGRRRKYEIESAPQKKSMHLSLPPRYQ